MPGLIALMDAEDQANMMQALDRAVSGQADYDAVFRVVQPDGMTRVLEDRAAILRDESGHPARMIGVLTDITDRKTTQDAERKLLAETAAANRKLRRSMTETHHRVKNSLQIIYSLVDLQLMLGEETIPIAEVRRLAKHIHILASIHDLLTNGDRDTAALAPISAKALLAQLLPMTQVTLGKRRLRWDVEELYSPAAQVAALGLIASELMSNALKHGTGEIELSLRSVGASVRLEVCDDGPGFPAGFDIRTDGHTGLQLIENLSRLDLRGRAAYENRSSGGARVVVVFPVAVPE